MTNSKTYFMKQGSSFRTTNEDNLQITKQLPPGHYTILVDQRGYFIEAVPEIKVEGKIYGDVGARVNRVLTTFGDRQNNTGILLEGEKGSGKTLLGRILAAELLKQGVSTLVINQPLFGEEFNTLIASIDQPLMIMFDEFEKTYPAEHQQKLLTLFDGTYSSKKLFVVTCNDGYRVVEFMKNRPGRMFYKFVYKGLDSKFVREYAEDVLKNKKHIDSIVNVAESFNSFNFDMLKAIVEEMNRYDETAGQALEYLNATPMDQRSKMKVIEVQSKSIPAEVSFDTHMNDGMPINPFNESMYITGRVKEEEEEKEDGAAKRKRLLRKLRGDDTGDEHYIEFFSKDIVEVRGGRFVIENAQAKVIFAKDSKEQPDYSWKNFL